MAQLSFNLIRTILLIALINVLIVDASNFAESDEILSDGIEEFLLRSHRSVADSPSEEGVRGEVGWFRPWWRDEKVDIAEEMTTLTQRLLYGIGKILDLFYEYTDELLVDALLGVKISNDQLTATLAQIEQKDSEMAITVNRLLQKGMDIMEIALPHTRDNFMYFKEVGAVLYLTLDWERSPKSFSKPISLRGMDEVDVRCEPPFFNESISDHCFSQLLHGKRSPNAPTTRCVLDDSCVERLFQRCHRYTLTHQALYLMIGIKEIPNVPSVRYIPQMGRLSMWKPGALIAKFKGPLKFASNKMGCTQLLNAKLSEMAPPDVQQQPTVDSILDGYCKDIYREAKTISMLGFPLNDRDIFIEQAVLCGLLNYVDFFRRDWAERILSWQQADGCFHKMAKSRDRKAEADGLPNGHHREKRRELLLKENCSSHTTSLATAYFSVLLRHITRPSLMQHSDIPLTI